MAIAPRATPAERRWNAGSWAALLFALCIASFSLSKLSVFATALTDGWAADISSRTDRPQVTLVYPVGQTATRLQAGDVVLAVNGLPIETMLDQAHRYFALPIPRWTAGTVLTYTVERAGQTLTLPVTLEPYDLRSTVAASLRITGLAGVIQLIASPFFFGLSLITFLIRPRQPAAHALLHIGTGFLFQIAPTFPSLPALSYPWTAPDLPWDTWMGAILPGLLYLMLAFPTPKWPLRRWPRLTVVGVYLLPELALNAAYFTHLNDPAGYARLATLTYAATALTVLMTTVVSLWHSARSLRDPVGRSQLKWITAGLFSFVIVGIGGWFAGYLGARLDLIQIVGNAGWFIFPMTLAIAITRYRLFDIDVIIRRTLVYGVITAVLAFVYFGSVIGLQGMLRGLTGGESPLVIVLSTLLIAALFAPVRARVQRTIDRRFYRRKYDATRTLAAFGAAARDEVDLDHLNSRLAQTVQDTMQPDSVGLWLRTTSKQERT